MVSLKGYASLPASIDWKIECFRDNFLSERRMLPFLGVVIFVYGAVLMEFRKS